MRHIMELSLREFIILDICCHVAGTFPPYTAGVFHSFRIVTLCIAMTNSPNLDLLLQRNEGARLGGAITVLR